MPIAAPGWSETNLHDWTQYQDAQSVAQLIAAGSARLIAAVQKIGKVE
ncbi:hypothetical protein ACVIU7_002676 [Bradyrhizobium liaoningense]|nr:MULTISPECIES: hypothetical protein [Bradyrhizobium]WLB90085.1 hypothetical protein QIH91_05835 [Bradyrhizobium japonicum USDA 135]